MRPERGVVRRFVAAEPCVAHEFEGKFFRNVAQYAFVKRAYAVNKFLQKFFETGGCLFVLFLVRVIPFAFVVCGKLRKIV